MKDHLCSLSLLFSKGLLVINYNAGGHITMASGNFFVPWDMGTAVVPTHRKMTSTNLESGHH